MCLAIEAFVGLTHIHSNFWAKYQPGINQGTNWNTECFFQTGQYMSEQGHIK